MLFLRTIPMWLIMGTIFFLSHQPRATLALPDIVNIDKVAHMVAYGALATTMIWAALPLIDRFSQGRLAVFIVCLSVLYGVSDEFHQSFIPGRMPSIYDIVADGIGALVVVLVWMIFLRVRTTRAFSG